MSTFTTEDRIQAEMYETIRSQAVKINELERLVDFWKLKCETMEEEVRALHEHLMKARNEHH